MYFKSTSFKTILEDKSVNLTPVAAEIFGANGQVEIVNNSVILMLAKLTESVNKWDQILNKVELVTNNTLHRLVEQNLNVLAVWSESDRLTIELD